MESLFNLTTTNNLSPIIPDGYTPNTFELAWFNLFEGTWNPSLKLAVILFLWHEFVFYSRYFPYAVLDYIPSFRKYRIQPDKIVTGDALRDVIVHVSLSQLFTQLPMMCLFKPLTESLGMRFLEAPFPSVALIALQCAIFVVVEDTYHYWGHRALHWGILYKWIHKQHHYYTATFGVAAEYASVAEVIILGIGFFLGPLIWSIATMGEWVEGAQCTDGFGQWLLGGCGGHYQSTEYSLHIVGVFAWLALRLILTVDNHCGYDFPWSIRHWFPVWAGADFHDYHHEKFIGNYGSTFRYWDWINGTDAGYAKRQESLKQKKVKSQ
ncbi:UNVERIFIED_CONTAM: C-4 sterol methyl oxidase [Siphonaria sp. JEL0065]|nr:C-4 sterol methyl oxidase [Siphonaria sp. JEL0065]